MAARKAKAAPAPEVEVVDKPGLSIDDGVVFFTTILFIIALVFMFMANDKLPWPIAS